MHGPINVKSPNNNSNWQMGFNSAFKGLIAVCKMMETWIGEKLLSACRTEY
jgi:Leu/Phe-tRNA-protein transferase